MTVYLQDPDVTLHHGDALSVLKTLEDASVHCCVTSPPFYGLRSYLDAGHDDKPLELGLEETPELWVQRLVAVFREVRRVLRPDGTLWLEVGDSYASPSGGGNVNLRTIQFGAGNESGKKVDTLEATLSASKVKAKVPGCKPKDLIGAPWMLAFALRADGWYLRSDIIWARPNPMPESVTDRPTKSHSYVFLLTRSPRYFFDQEAVREPASPYTIPKRASLGSSNPKHEGVEGVKPSFTHSYNLNESKNDQSGDRRKIGFNERWDESEANGQTPNGRNARSVWNIATQPYPEAHFATFPEALARRCILAGTSERGCCPECGTPWQRNIETTDERVGEDRGGNYDGIPKTDGTKVMQGGYKPGSRYVTIDHGWNLPCATRRHRALCCS